MIPANFDINKQCPQVYIYIFSVLTSVLIAAKYGDVNEVFVTSVVGVVVTVLLMGINFCDWNFQWLTWYIAAGFLLGATLNVLYLFSGDKQFLVYGKRNRKINK